jgi:hypothetical protein
LTNKNKQMSNSCFKSQIAAGVNTQAESIFFGLNEKAAVGTVAYPAACMHPALYEV